MDNRTLGQCIRDGAKIRGKADGVLYCQEAETSCALGAAIEGKFGTYKLLDSIVRFHVTTHPLDILINAFPQLQLSLWTGCPMCDARHNLCWVIAHLNNSNGHDQSREWIADWLDANDPKAMDIGKPRREILVEPLEEPVPKPLSEPTPEGEPVSVPDEEEVPA